jgi:hypothetical protein
MTTMTTVEKILRTLLDRVWFQIGSYINSIVEYLLHRFLSVTEILMVSMDSTPP